MLSINQGLFNHFAELRVDVEELEQWLPIRCHTTIRRWTPLFGLLSHAVPPGTLLKKYIKNWVYKRCTFFFLHYFACIHVCVRTCVHVCFEVSIAMCAVAFFLQCEFQGSDSGPWSLGFKRHYTWSYLTSPSNANFNGLLSWYQCIFAIVGGSLCHSEHPSLKFSIQGQMRW